MSKLRFVGLDVHADTIAVAVAETGRGVRSMGVITNCLESIRKLVRKLGPVEHLRALKRSRSDRVWSKNWIVLKTQVIRPLGQSGVKARR